MGCGSSASQPSSPQGGLGGSKPSGGSGAKGKGCESHTSAVSSKYTAGASDEEHSGSRSAQSGKSRRSSLVNHAEAHSADGGGEDEPLLLSSMPPPRPRSKSLLAQDMASDSDSPLDESIPHRTRNKGSFRRKSRRSITNTYNDSLTLPDWWHDSSISTEDKLGMLFDVLDADHGGTIDLQELGKGLQSFGFSHSLEQINQMFGLADSDGGGDIDRNEFARFFKGLMVDEEDSDDESPSRPQVDKLAASMAAMTPLLEIRQRPVGTFIRPVRGLKTVTFTGSPSRIKCVATGSAFRGFFACDRQETQLHLLDNETGHELRTYTGHQDAIMSVSVACTGRHICTAGRDGVLIIWDTTCGSIVKEIEHPGAVTCCVFSPDARSVVTGCQDNLVRRWNARCGKVVACSEVAAAGRGGIVLSIAHSPDYMDASQQLLAVTRSRDVAVFLMCATTLRLLCSLPGHSAMLWNVSFACDRKMLLSACENEIRVWDTTHTNGVRLLSSFPVAVVPGGDGNTLTKVTGRIWTTAMFCNGDFSHVFVGACSGSSLLFMHATEGTVLASITVKAPVYCMSAGQGNDCCMGDEFGNLYRFELC